MRELSELSGVSVAALRKRCERGQLRYVVRAGARRVPRIEAEAAGLRLSPKPAQADQVIAELLRQLTAAQQELLALRQLPQRVEQAHRDLAGEAAAKTAAETALTQERAAHQQLREQLVASNWLKRRQLLRQLRSNPASA